MALWDQITRILALEPWHEADLQTRSVPDASLQGFIARIQGERERPWRIASTTDALSVPAILSAVTLISNGMGSMSLKAYKNGNELPDDERPQIIIRPNPFTIPRDFFRDTAYSMAVHGEAWWWIAKRDFDDLPMSLIPVNPVEVTVKEDPDDLRFPIIEWRGRRMPNRDMRQITYLRQSGSLRGSGPLQLCGAAVSVAVEAQEWAANFYAEGGYPSLGIEAAHPLGGDPEDPDADDPETEATRFREAWMSVPHNSPRVWGPDEIAKIHEFNVNQQGAQMLEARSYNAIEAAQMFTMPAPMIEAAVAGQNLTYQNIPDLYDSFARRCLAPNYAEPIEQTMSDLLTRSTVARHNFDALLRVDLKTRWEVYEIAAKVLGAEEAATLARRKEGIAPGDVEFAAMPPSPPQAIPASLPVQGRSAAEVRCQCGSLLAELAAPPYRFRCRKCKAVTEESRVLETRSEPIIVTAPAPLAPNISIAPSPVNFEPGAIQSVVNMPPLPEPAPVNVTVTVPEQVMASFSEKVAGVSAGQDDIRAQLSKLADAHTELAAQVAAPKAPRRFIPERDEKGVIVAVTEAA